MAEEIKNEEQVETPETNYINVIKQMKANSVDKSEYERVLQQNRELAESLMYSQPSETVEEPQYTEEDIQNLRNSLGTINSNKSNMQVIREALELRDAVIANGGRDPFVAWNSDTAPSEYDIEKKQEQADALKQILDYCNGNSELFQSELLRCCK